MRCPECGTELEPSINKYQSSDEFVEVELYCANEHGYFVRIKEDDLIALQ